MPRRDICRVPSVTLLLNIIEFVVSEEVNRHADEDRECLYFSTTPGTYLFSWARCGLLYAFEYLSVLSDDLPCCFADTENNEFRHAFKPLEMRSVLHQLFLLFRNPDIDSIIHCGPHFVWF